MRRHTPTQQDRQGARARLRLDHAYILTDLLALASAYTAARALRFHPQLGPFVYGIVNALLGWGWAANLDGTVQEAAYGAEALRYLVPFGLALYFLYAMQGMYQEHRFLSSRPVLWKVTVANAAVLGGVLSLLYLRRNVWHPRSFFVTVFAFNTVFCVVLRMLARQTVARLRERRGWWPTPALLVGETPEAATVDEIVTCLRPHGIRIVERLPAPPASGELDALAGAMQRTGARLVIVADARLSVATTMHILDLTAHMNAAAKVLTHTLSVLQTRAGEEFDTILGTPLVHFEDPAFSDKNTWWRHGISRLLAALALLGLAPFLLVVALLIKLTDRGPVFFVQERFGIDQRPFKMYKFRTMRVDAEQLLAQMEARNEAGGGLFKLKRDPRVTPIGRLLRKYSIDELPQIFNVLKGDMRIVGPRPLPRRDVNNYYEAWHYHRHHGRPGLTCLWQVSGRSTIDFENMCILDVYYLRNRNWPMDLRIVTKTVGVVLLGRGAY